MKRLLGLLLLAPLTFTPPLAAQSATRVPTSAPLAFDGMHLEPDGTLYLAGSWKGSQIVRRSPGGEFEVFAEGFDGPTDIAFDSQGRLYVTNYTSNYVSRVTPDGEVSRFATTPLGPAGIAIDGEDHVYVTVFGTPAGEGRSILRIAPDGTVETWADSPQLHASVGLAVDDKGVVYVLTGREARILRIPSKGVIETYSALPLIHGVGGGAHLDWADGHLFAASGNGQIFRIAPGGAAHLVLEAGPAADAAKPGPLTTGVPRSPLLGGLNGLTASADGRTLYVGCLDQNERTLVRIDGARPPLSHLEGWRAIQRSDFETAERIYAELTRTEPVAPEVWFGLGTLRYRDGEPELAADFFGRAAVAPHLRAFARYNQACSLGILGRVDAAFVALEGALDAGFADWRQVRQDADLAALRDDPRWLRLLERAPAASTGGAQ